jgi:hypothetical protein
MDLLDRVGQKTRNKKSPDQMGLFQPQGRKAKTLLLAWLFASLKAFWGRDPWRLSANGTFRTSGLTDQTSATDPERKFG